MINFKDGTHQVRQGRTRHEDGGKGLRASIGRRRNETDEGMGQMVAAVENSPELPYPMD